MFDIKKSDFIKFSLQPFIQRLDESIECLAYEYDDGTAEEHCNITYKNGYRRKVCITADSERGITSDVLKVL